MRCMDIEQHYRYVAFRLFRKSLSETDFVQMCTTENIGNWIIRTSVFGWVYNTGTRDSDAATLHLLQFVRPLTKRSSFVHHITLTADAYFNAVYTSRYTVDRPPIECYIYILYFFSDRYPAGEGQSFQVLFYPDGNYCGLHECSEFNPYSTWQSLGVVFVLWLKYDNWRH